MQNLTLLRALRKREDFEYYRSAIPIKALDEHTAVIVKAYVKYYDSFPKEDAIDFVTLRDYFARWNPDIASDPDKMAVYDKVLRYADQEVDRDLKNDIINGLIELQFATDTANVIQDYQLAKEVSPLEAIRTLLDSADSRINRGERTTYVPPDLSELFLDDKECKGLQFRYDILNRSIRPLRGGDFLILAARPDQGKTSFIADNGTFMATQDDRPVLWLSNEGVRDNIVKRSYSAALGDTINGLVERQTAGVLGDDLQAALGSLDAVQIEDICGWTNIEVGDLITQINPCLVILDMIDKIKFQGLSSNARTDQVLEEQYSWFRELGIKHDYATIATSQISAAACDTMDTQMWPRDDMLKDSKTGKQGACDVIIMMGHSQDVELSDMRYWSAPKNKLKPPGAPDLRASVSFDADRCRYRSGGG